MADKSLAGCAAGICIALVSTLAKTQDGPAVWPGLQRNVVFDRATPLSSNDELASRLLTPLTVARIKSDLARTGKSLEGQPIDLSKEHFLIYTPAKAPPAGYGLLVFIPPWEDARLPLGWSAVLDRYGLIFVTAAASGNDEDILGRRAPLALAAADNVLQRYPVDRQRVFIAGFSGGSRIALRLALGYPDLFRGALLNAGSDPIGHVELPLPPKALLYRFQSESKLVFVTGANDAINLNKDAESRLSLQDWCVFDLQDQTSPGVGHDVASASALDRALDGLLKPARPDPARMERCRAAKETELQSKLVRLDALKAQGKLKDARRLLESIDASFGGFAAGSHDSSVY